MIIVATALVTEAQQSAVHMFCLSLTQNTVIVHGMPSDGQAVFARLQFGGQRFILASEDFV